MPSVPLEVYRGFVKAEEKGIDMTDRLAVMRFLDETGYHEATRWVSANGVYPIVDLTPIIVPRAERLRRGGEAIPVPTEERPPSPE